jgi:hypothetical protein
MSVATPANNLVFLATEIIFITFSKTKAAWTAARLVGKF